MNALRAPGKLMIRAAVAALALAALVAVPGRAAGAADWTAWKFLLGEWIGEGAGQPGAGEGGFSFALDLEGRILVRKSRTAFPATQGRPAFVHDDLLIIWPAASGPAGAIYFDNEDHVIEYEAAAAADGKSATFVSEARPGAPRFRLVYALRPDGGLAVKFEMAPPGKPDDFSPYLEGGARRKS